MKSVDILGLFDDESKGKEGASSMEMKAFHVRYNFEISIHNSIYSIYKRKIDTTYSIPTLYTQNKYPCHTLNKLLYYL